MEIFVILKETKELHGCCRVGDYFLVNMKNALGKIATLCRNWREGEMDLLKLSKFQLQLRALISEVHHLKERDQSASKQLQLLVQKQKKAEEETNKKLADLQAELVVSNELQQKLERKVNCLESENALLENRQKELKETINNLLQSRESFVKAYEDSTCEMKRAMESRDRMILFLSEKIKSHSLLVNSIEKEASSIKQIVNDTEYILTEKEEAAVKLKKKLHEIATFEKLFIERISDLECKIRNNEEELTRKDKIILCLEAQLKMAKTQDEFQPTVDELQKALSTKELIIQNLASQKKVLHLEVGSLSFIIKKIQDAVTHMNEKDRKAFSSFLEGQVECVTIEENKPNGWA
ncbi:rho-associated protein kinase 1 isoform X4 [Olea europaea var. sylvestris]|uniref:rho-associated protein kinase 1 isoform X4 n=1 Tax=Olea europaea var. sylvestris TaxID=158386 RepID=UPI000C1D484B|nr:rho-associated protein kinase 1 isoform X4 [Olea europaea var. sylvestris]